MILIYDNIEDGVPLPNGLDSPKLKTIYLNNFYEYTNYCALRCPKFIKAQDKKLELDTKGIYPISIDASFNDTVNSFFVRNLINVGISEMSFNKIVKGDLKLAVFIENELSNGNSFFDLYFVLSEYFKNFLIYTSKTYDNLNSEMKNHYNSDFFKKIGDKNY